TVGWIKGGAAPCHAADVARDEERSAQAGRRENPFGTETGDPLAAPFAVGLGTLDLLDVQLLERQRAGSEGERLCGRCGFARHVALGNRPLLDAEDGLAGV